MKNAFQMFLQLISDNWVIYFLSTMNRYFVELPANAITESLLRETFLETEMFPPPVENISSSVRLDGDHLWKAFFKSSHTFLVEHE